MWYDSDTHEAGKLQQREYQRKATRHVSRLSAWIVAIVILLIGAVGVGNLIYHLPAITGQVFSQENVGKQWDFAYQYHASLNAVAEQICETEKKIARATSEREATYRRSQQIAHEQHYAEVEAIYTIRMQEALRAGLVPSADVSKKAPTLLMIKKQRCSPREAS